MKLVVVLGALLFAAMPVFADPADEPVAAPIDDPGTPDETTPVDETVPPVPPVPKKAARMTTPQPHVARPKPSKDDGESKLDKKEDTVAGGKHWRIVTSAGAVHVWVPADYSRDTAGTVIYVHGYWTNADGAWRDHELARQFKASHQNAMFVVPDAPAGNEDSVNR